MGRCLLLFGLERLPVGPAPGVLQVAFGWLRQPEGGSEQKRRFVVVEEFSAHGVEDFSKLRMTAVGTKDLGQLFKGDLGGRKVLPADLDCFSYRVGQGADGALPVLRWGSSSWRATPRRRGMSR